MSSTYFYQNLPRFKRFKDITQDQYFVPAPSDWKIVITDVKGSTKAIEANHYKDVNTIGAASIVSAHNALGDLEFPYVFGGDGATLLIPATYQDKISTELTALKLLSQQQFGLELRIGMIGVDEIIATGAVIEVAKLALVKNKAVAIFRGGGLSLAEKKIKSDEHYAIKNDDHCSTDLHSLSCRWQPIPAKRGKILSLLVSAKKQENKLIYDQVLNKLENIYQGQLDDANPINQPTHYSRFFECYHNEKRLHTSLWSIPFLIRLIEIMASVLIYRYHLSSLISYFKRYTTTLATHSDYRKFDDMLRMIIDCTPTQIILIRSFLEELHQQGEINYGLHESDHSLMTCFVDHLSEGNHIHFIDGGNGGYAMAAKGLKAQLAEH